MGGRCWHMSSSQWPDWRLNSLLFPMVSWSSLGWSQHHHQPLHHWLYRGSIQSCHSGHYQAVTGRRADLPHPPTPPAHHVTTSTSSSSSNSVIVIVSQFRTTVRLCWCSSWKPPSNRSWNVVSISIQFSKCVWKCLVLMLYFIPELATCSLLIVILIIIWLSSQFWAVWISWLSFYCTNQCGLRLKTWDPSFATLASLSDVVRGGRW